MVTLHEKKSNHHKPRVIHEDLHQACHHSWPFVIGRVPPDPPLTNVCATCAPPHFGAERADCNLPGSSRRQRYHPRQSRQYLPPLTLSIKACCCSAPPLFIRAAAWPCDHTSGPNRLDCGQPNHQGGQGGTQRRSCYAQSRQIDPPRRHFHVLHRRRATRRHLVELA